MDTSVLVCTRSRPEMLRRLLLSLLSSTEGQTTGSGSLELIVVDQSEGSEVEEVISSVDTAGTVRLVRSRARGKGAALNEGLQVARGEILVCTDDDCEAPPGWARAMTGALMERPEAAALFCQVLPTPGHDAERGYIPAYTFERSRTLKSLAFAHGRFGLGAGMAVRTEVMRSLAGFDETLGPGSLFPSCDDWDVAIRVLLRGWHVHDAAELSILHHGYRTLEEGRAHARRDWLALGAVCAKPLRAGYWTSLTLPAWVFGVYALWPPLFDVLRLRRPRGLTRIVAFLQGFARGLGTPVDPETLRFVPEGPRDSP